MAGHNQLRAYLPPGMSRPGDSICLPPFESSHLVRARRARTGDRVGVFDGTGNEWLCQLEGTSPAGATLKVLKHWEASRPACFLTLAPAVLKGKSTDLVIEKAVELGVSRIIPLITARSEVKLDPVRAAKRISRWQSVAVEACKQSGNSFLPDITPIQPLPEFLDQKHAFHRRFVASLQDDAQPLGAVASIPDAQSIIWLVGPEGDFSVGEYRQIRKHGFQPISLGANTLRSETAAIVALGITRILLASEPGG